MQNNLQTKPCIIGPTLINNLQNLWQRPRTIFHEGIRDTWICQPPLWINMGISWLGTWMVFWENNRWYVIFSFN